MLAERISTMPVTDPQTAANPALSHKLLSVQEVIRLQDGLDEHMVPPTPGYGIQKKI
jgi:hypothetical protein